MDHVLTAGLRQGTRCSRTDIGTPQGAIGSPWMANRYVPQMDLYWWTHYGGRGRQVKARRRHAHQGHCALSRSADDGLRLTNGTTQTADHLREALQTFLAEALQLALAVEKTHITHVNDGCDVLGCPVRRSVGSHDQPKMLVTPSDKAQQRLKATLQERTARPRCREAPRRKLSALNAVRRGWIT